MSHQSHDISLLYKMKFLTLLLLTVPTVLSDSCFEVGVDYFGNDLEEGKYVSVPSAEACQASCQGTSGCEFWTWDPTYHNSCWRKTAKTQTQSNPVVTSGPKYCDTPQPDPNQLKVMSYNMWDGIHSLDDPVRAGNIYNIIRTFTPDLLGGQESRASVAYNIGNDYAAAGEANGHTIIYRTSVLALNDYGNVNISPNDMYGVRSVEWAQFTHVATGTPIDHFNTHFCVCAGDGRCCGQEAQYQSAKEAEEIIVAHKREGSLIVFTGDFNVQDGYENSKAIRHLKGEIDNPPVPLEDTFRAANGAAADGTTFPGQGKIDYVFASPGTSVASAVIDRGDYGPASDHWPINAIINL